MKEEDKPKLDKLLTLISVNYHDRRTPEEITTWHNLMGRMLRNYEIPVLNMAFAEIMKHEHYIPNLATILRYAEAARVEQLKLEDKARRAKQLEDKEYRVPPGAVKELLAGFWDKMGGRPNRKGAK